MSCVRKRGAKWTAQVRVSGWRSFTKTFAKAKRFAVMPLVPHQLKHYQLENQPASANH